MYYILDYNHTTEEVIAFDVDAGRAVKIKYGQLDDSTLINARKVFGGFTWFQGCEYSLRVHAQTSVMALERNFVMRELSVRGRLFGYEVVLAASEGRKVYWYKKQLSVREAIKYHEKYHFQNVKYVESIGKLVPKYGELSNVDLTQENEQRRLEDERKKEAVMTHKANNIAKELQKRHPSMGVVRKKLETGFKNKSALIALCAVLALASVGGAGVIGASKLSQTAYNIDTSSSMSVGQKAPVDDFSCKIRINESERAVIDADGNVKIDGFKCGSLSDFNNIREFELVGNSGSVLTAYEHSKFIQSKENGTLKDSYLNSDDASSVSIKTAAFGSSKLTVQINDSTYEIKKNKITKDNSVVYRVESKNNERIIEKLTDDSEMTMSRAILLLEYLNGYNDYVREMDIKAE